jgi:glycogen(starch) synthase
VPDSVWRTAMITTRSEPRFPPVEPAERAPERPRKVEGSPLLFEISWEVCCQAGGIYTVLRSKAPAAAARWGDGYWLIGPYREHAARIEFEPQPADGTIGEVVAMLAEEGIVFHAGHWLIAGHPRVLLLDLSSVAARHNELKYCYWQDCRIGTPPGDHEVNEIVALGYSTAEFLMRIHERLGDRPMLAHCHEWQGAAVLPILRHRGARFPTVFTTHATLVGRSLSSSNVELYEHLHNINGEQVAYEYGFAHRFMIERAAAECADVFTTVSGITALESEQFLNRKPDLLLPNGLNVERFSAPYQFQNLHRENKERIHEFVRGHFFPSYTFDLDRTLYVFTAGRYEYRNKGFDTFIEALYQLNHRLKIQPTGVTIVAFVIAPAPFRSLNVGALNRQAMLNELREQCEATTEQMGQRLFRLVADGRLPTIEDLLDEERCVALRRMMHAWKQNDLPAVVTHDLVDDAHDPILCHLRHRGLLNAPDDPVKVVFHPQFITSTSPVIGLEYDQFVRGCNLGVFPSYYEPWGYTPMECVARGIPAITSDLSGFGTYVMSHFPDHDENGIYVARYRGVPIESTTAQVTEWLHALTRMSHRERIELRNRVERHAEHFDWSNLTRYYRAARRWAFEKYYPGREILPPESDADA